MKLQVPFVQLPLMVDADLLAKEIAAFDESEWRPHPQGYPGNSALALVAVNGDPSSDALRGPMKATPLLQRCPYLRQVLASLDVTIGRTRLMRLSGQSEVTPHVDTAYYWWQRVRVHIPITTQPTVRFICGDAEVNMAAGECWIFDTWRMHRVLNDADKSRVHLVIDTVGGEGFTTHLMGGRPHHVTKQGWNPSMVAMRDEEPAGLRFEKENLPAVMTPWEVREYLWFLLNEALPHPQLQIMQSILNRFDRHWQALWACYGELHEGWPEYRRALDAFLSQMQQQGGGVMLRNGPAFLTALTHGFALAALADRNLAQGSGEPREAINSPVARSTSFAVDPLFDRPVFIISPPRSGSTLLFETLAKTSNVFTIGDESHGLIEDIPGLHPVDRGFESNRLDADAATPAVIAALREGFYSSLRNRDGFPPVEKRVRLLEKTPKNALRIPFLAKVFPEARFIYLYRDVHETLASMIEAWTSGRFRTYPQLPGWTGLSWSLLLTPGWRSLIGKPLHEIVGAQWNETMRIALNDLEQLARDSWCSIRYDALLANPDKEIARLCRIVDFGWDQTLGNDLPLSRYTVSEPNPLKWKRHEAQILELVKNLETSIDLAKKLAKQ